MFHDIKWMLDEAQKRGAKVVLTMGMRQPRWPECHFPVWVNDLKKEVRDIKVQELVFKTVDTFKHHPAIEVWQVENEPLLEFFGECPLTDRELLKREVDLVRALDDRPILITASGELSTWYPEALWGDFLGSTMYRTTWNEWLAKIPGYDGFWSYWFIPPSLYRLKAMLLGKLDSYWIAELQAEPWFSGSPLDASLDDMYRTMSPEQILENVEFAQKVNSSRIYLWGAEWWYYTKEIIGVNAVWETVKRLDW